VILRPILFVCLFLASPFRLRADEPWPALFDPFRVQTIYIQIDASKWNSILHDTNVYDPERNVREPCQLWMDGDTAPNSPENSITVQIRRKSDPALPDEGSPVKVSLKIDVNEYVPGQSIRGVKKLSLENGAGGNGVLREGFAMNLHRLAADAGYYPFQTGNASWVRLVVNGNFVGVYSCPEQRDVTFLKNRGMYKEQASWLYEINGGIELDPTVATTHSPTYEHLDYPPFRLDAAQPANYEEDIQQWVDMRALLTLASIESFISNTDGLFTKSANNQGKNTFCADWLPSPQAKRVYLPWDLDGGFSNTSWNIFSGGSGQQAQRRFQTQILQHEWFGEYYRHIYTELLDGPLSLPALNTWLDQLEAVLGPALAGDPNADAGGFSGLRTWLANRTANVRTQIGSIIQPPTFVLETEETSPVAAWLVTHSNTIGISTVFYTIDGSDPRAAGGLPAPASLVYNGPVSLAGSTFVRARVRNVNGASTRWSALREAAYDAPEALHALKLTEIHYQPAPLAGFEDADEAEFLEFKNLGAVPLDLSGCSLDGVGWRFEAGTRIGPGEFLVLAGNPAAFEQRYPGVPCHSVFWRNLSNGGEKLRLRNASGVTVVSCDYAASPPWPLAAAAMGHSLVNMNPAGNPDVSDHWRASTYAGGSPGMDDPPPPWAAGVVINEVVAKTSSPLEDAIELCNTGTAPADVSGWWLSDDYDPSVDPALAMLKKFRIPDGTVIPPGGYQVFYQVQFNGPAALSPFSLTQDGETVYLSSADAAGNLTGFITGQRFTASESNVAQGRVTMSSGWDFAALKAHTFGASAPLDRVEFRSGTGAANAGPLVGPVVVSEINYHPVAGGVEFIEIGNASDLSVALDGWSLEGAGGFTFPAGTTLAPNSVLVIADVTDAAAFRSVYSVPDSITVWAHSFDLGDAGESVELLKPNPEPGRPAIRAERFRYNDKAPWPASAGGSGGSLERILPLGYGNDPANWQSSVSGGTPGTWAWPNTPDADGDGLPDAWELTNGLDPSDPEDAEDDPDGDGASNAFEFLCGTHPLQSASVLHLRAAGHDASGLRLQFDSVPGKRYQVEYSEDLVSWNPQGPVVEGTGSAIELSDEVAVLGQKRYYRVGVISAN
jgi:hypothetical protein